MWVSAWFITAQYIICNIHMKIEFSCLLSVPVEFAITLDFVYCGKLSFVLIANKYRKS